MPESPTPPSVEAGTRTNVDYYAKAFHSSPVVTLLAQVSDGRIIDANEAFFRSSGYTRQEIIGRTTIEIGLWPNPADRAAVIAELNARGCVRDYEAEFNTKSGASRYTLLNGDIIKLEQTTCMLITVVDLTERRRREQIQDAIYRISQTVLTGEDLGILYGKLHQIVAGLMPAKNFYIALLGEDDGLIHFPYFVDEYVSSPAPRKPVLGMTEYVLQTGKGVLATSSELAVLLSQLGQYTPVERAAAVRLAVPLLISGRAIGVLAVQDYTNAHAYDQDHQRLLTFVADQVAVAVHRQLSDVRQRESQQYFAKSFQTTPALMIVARLSDGQILEANAGFERISGFTRSEAMHRNTLELNLWASVRERTAFIDRMRHEGRVRDFEGVFRTRSGESKRILLNADVFEMRGEKCMLTIGVDITERRRREQVQDATYRIAQAAVAGHSLDSFWGELHQIVASLMSARNFYVALLSPDQSLLSFPYFVDECSAPPPPVKPGDGLTEYVLQTGRAVLTSADELTYLQHEGVKYAPKGKPAALWLGAPLIVAGKAIGAVVVQDYTDARCYDEEDKRLLTYVATQAAAAVQRRESELAAQRAEQQYRGIFENAIEGLYQTTPEGRFLRANPAMANLLGYPSVDDLISAVNDIGQQFYASPGRRAEFLTLIQHTDNLSGFESEIRCRDGSFVWISESVRVRRNAAGEAVLFEGIAINVTARREAARVLREAKEAADSASRAKSQFLASMSHELRTPLNGILGYTQILNRDTTLTDKQRNGIDIIHQSAGHLLNLINDVLDLAKIEARKMELHPVEFVLSEFAQGVVDVFAPKAREKGLQLDMSIAANLPAVVKGDVQRIRQVVFNLVGNAIKFTPNGVVGLSIERVQGNVRVVVTDSGPGISPDDQARLFEPFAQVGDHGAHIAGTGLGLNISQRILENMGSRLMLESKPGWGSRFWFDLALPEGSPEELVDQPIQETRYLGYAGPRLRVLVADDNLPNRVVLSDLLNNLGFVVDLAADGQQAVIRAQDARPDLILLDLRMPLMDGFSAARSIHAYYAENPPCIIAVSASTQPGLQEAAKEAHCAAFVTKPYKDQDLLEVIGRALPLQWLTSERGTSTHSAPPFAQVEIVPDAADIEALFELASKGDVIGVRGHTQQMAARNPQLAPFAQQILDLSARFRMKAIRSLLERYRPTSGRST